ncbi:unnamed protein product, partial [Rotaria socialis]
AVCPLQPQISSNLTACTAVQVGQTFTFTLTVVQGCSGTTLVDFFTMPPLYMIKGSIVSVGSIEWTITETWIPTTTQLGSQALEKFHQPQLQRKLFYNINNMGYTFEIYEYADSNFGFCLPPRFNANLCFSGQVPVQQQLLQQPQQRRAIPLLQQV